MCERHGVTARMSKVVKHGGTIYLSGQVPEDISLVPDIAEQTRSVLHKIDRLLTESGSDRSHILSATIYLKDMAHFSGMNEVWDTWIPQGEAPARTCVQAGLYHEDVLVEITIVAAVRVFMTY